LPGDTYPDDDEGIEQVEANGWNNEQIHGGNVRRVVMQEGPPSLAGRPPSFDHLLGDARMVVEPSLALPILRLGLDR
jgi:hypothetical protein